MARLVFAGREVWPMVQGGGIGRYVWTVTSMLAAHHDVTILTSGAHRSAYERMLAESDPRLPAGVAWAFADEPEGDVSPFVSVSQAWSVRLLEALPALTPDLVEFGDYLGEGFAAVHARRAGDPRLRRTAVVVRAHTSGEIVAGLNDVPASPATSVLWALERFPIRHADALLWPGGDVLDRYRATYGTTAAPVRLPLPFDPPPAAGAPPPQDGPLRLLFLNRLERRKGIVELIEALRGLPGAEIELSVVGRDTDTAPGGGSMRAHLEGMEDARVRFVDQVAHEEVAELVAQHHAVVVPSAWETFSYVVREALAAGRPVLGTAVGAIPDAVVPGRSGWLAASHRVEDLREALERLELAEALELIAGGGPRAALEASSPSAEEVAGAYAELAAADAPERGPAGPVTAIVRLRQGDAGLSRTLLSLRAQHGPPPRVLLAVEPGALRASHLLATEEVVEGGLAEALAQAGAGPVLLLPCGAQLEPDFVTRAAAALDGFDYATAYCARGSRPWHAPLGGEDLDHASPPAAASVALARRDAAERAVTAGSWNGLRGVVLHEPLVRRLPRRGNRDLV